MDMKLMPEIPAFDNHSYFINIDIVLELRFDCVTIDFMDDERGNFCAGRKVSLKNRKTLFYHCKFFLKVIFGKDYFSLLSLSIILLFEKM